MSDEPTTICMNCETEFPVADACSCGVCGLDPLCPSCVCENCPGE